MDITSGKGSRATATFVIPPFNPKMEVNMEKKLREKIGEEALSNGLDEFLKNEIHPLLIEIKTRSDKLSSLERNMMLEPILLGLAEIMNVKDTTRVMTGVRMMRRFSE